MLNFTKFVEKELTVGFRVLDCLIDIVDVLCKRQDLNRRQCFRRALESYEPMRSVLAEFERGKTVHWETTAGRSMISKNTRDWRQKGRYDFGAGLIDCQR
jgi:hypothetical protein